MKPVHFLFVTLRNIFRFLYIQFVLVFSTNLRWPMKLFSPPWKMQSRFSRREHPRNTNRSLFPSFLLFFFSFIFILFFLFFIRFPRVASWQKKTRGVPPPQVACKNAEWRREFFRSSHRYPDPGRNVREVRYGNRGCLLSTRNSLVSNVHCRFSLKDIRGLDARCQDVIPYFPVSTVSFFHVGFLLHNWTCSFIEIHESMVLLVSVIFLRWSRNLCYRICEIEMIVDALIKRRILILILTM